MYIECEINMKLGDKLWRDGLICIKDEMHIHMDGFQPRIMLMIGKKDVEDER